MTIPDEVYGHVLPLTREWIEIRFGSKLFLREPVLPLTREWIEISVYDTVTNSMTSSPSYEGVD